MGCAMRWTRRSVDITLLKVKDLSVRFHTDDGIVNAVDHLNFSLNAGETLAIVGESGSGKSQTAFAILGLLARNGIASGAISYDGEDILNVPLKRLNQIRATEIGIVFQDPMTSLNPYMQISNQMAEVLIYHKGMEKKAAIHEAIRILDAVNIPDAKARIRLYPHEFSGGMRQRVMIAMALLAGPRLLIADEPTTALDVTIQAQIMTLFATLQKELGMAVILITHDLGVVAGFCEEVLVMYGGRVMERASTEAIFTNSAHPYTRGLLKTIPRLDATSETLNTIPGSPPNMLNPPAGCPFAPRCHFMFDECTKAPISLEAIAPNHWRACYRPVEDMA